MKTLNKIISLTLLSLVSLTGCMKVYKTDKDNERIIYNKNLASPMAVYRDSAKVIYHSASWENLLGKEVEGKDITEISIAKAKPALFPRRTTKYELFPKKYSINNPEDSEIMKQERENFDKYMKIVQAEEKRK